MSDFKSASIPLDYIPDVFPQIRPRQFSIASSPKVWSVHMGRRCMNQPVEVFLDVYLGISPSNPSLGGSGSLSDPNLDTAQRSVYELDGTTNTRYIY